MSRLSRFKKGAVLKLPPMRVKAANSTPDNEDDDFQDSAPSLPKPKPMKMIKEVSVEKASSSGTKNANSVESIYFNADGKVAVSKENFKSESQNDTEDEKVQSKTTVSKSKVRKEVTPQESDSEDIPLIVDLGKKVVCPFCWKKLGDKLSGTTHVKSCGKNLPTERIFEAMQLHDKQVKEWEGLGIAYPGFASSSNSKTGKPRNPKPRSREAKKKDPELELAMALSVSLHEEIETRKLKEKQFLVESGLEKEVESLESSSKNSKADPVEPIVSYRMKPEKKCKIKLPKMLSAQNLEAGVKRRGKKDTNLLTETKLYTTTEVQRQNIINERVGVILEETTNVVHEEYYVRDKANIPVEVPQRLQPFHKENSPLWKLAALEFENNTRDEFIIQDIAESKLRNDREVAKVPNDPVSGNKVETIEKQLEIEVNPLPKFVEQCSPPTDKSFRNQEEIFPPTISDSGTHVSRHSTTSTTFSDFSVNHESDGSYPQVIHDLLKLLSRKIFTDVLLFSREEKFPIKCHKLMLKARCPKILDDIAKCRSSSTGKIREIISLTEYSQTAVKGFLAYVYSGRIKSSLKPEELEELRSLANKYGMPLVSEEPPRKKLKVMCAEVQTDPFVMEMISSYSQTEENEIIEMEQPIELAEKSLDDIFDKSINSEIFAGHSKGDDNIFENRVADPQPEPKMVMIGEKEDEDIGNVSEDIFGEFEEDDEDDDDLFNELANNMEEKEIPSTDAWENCSAKKRTRSISQLSDSSATSFSATQAALYWKKRINSENQPEKAIMKSLTKKTKVYSPLGSRSSRKSVKKLKKCTVEQTNSENESSSDNEAVLNKNIDEAEVIVLGDSEDDGETVYGNNGSPKENLESGINEIENNEVANNSVNLDMSLSWEDTYANANEIENDICENVNDSISLPNKSSVLCETPKNRFSSQIRNIERTSNRLSLENVRNHNVFSPSYSPLKLSFLDRSNLQAFGDHDDSVFAKIPEELFNNAVGDQCGDFEEISPLVSKSDANRKCRGKSKAKGNNKVTAPTKEISTQAKRRKPRGHSFSQEPQSSCRTPQINEPSAVADGRTPMLNYSTIDTPILKNELKRFGLKPLPRTKAKVLLRHIYKETHK